MSDTSQAGPAVPAGPASSPATGRVDTALARCIALPADAFAAQHWGSAPLLTRAADFTAARGAAGFDDLLDRAAVDELVSTHGLRTPFLRMAKEGSLLPAKTFTRAGGAGAGIADQVADDLVLARLDEGATLVLQALHRTWPPLVRFGSQLAAELGHPVQINAYVTPPDNRGFASHYDVHDVFVLQVAGRKRWRIHRPVVVDPLEDNPWERSRDEVSARAAGEPLIDTVLEPGDALYLPRGTIHAAEALGETSIHLTVGVHPITRYDLVRALSDLAADQPELRSSLPMGADLADPAVLRAQLASTVDALVSWLTTAPAEALEVVARRVGDRLGSQTRPEPVSPLATLEAAASLTLTTQLRLRGALRVRVEFGTEHVRLVLPDRTLTLPLAAAEAVKTITTGEPFAVTELPGLADDERLVVARRLLREAVLIVVDAPCHAAAARLPAR